MGRFWDGFGTVDKKSLKFGTVMGRLWDGEDGEGKVRDGDIPI